MEIDGIVKLYQPVHETKGEYLGVIPVDNIVCAVPLVPDYEHEMATIPASAAPRMQNCFPDGQCDPPARPGKGNNTYFLNPFAAKYSDVDGVAMYVNFDLK